MLDRPESVLAYSVVYLETISLGLALGNLAKISFRRPRPLSYLAAAEGTTLDDTDSSLSFYSMHTAFTASIGATATYLAFMRGGEIEPWVTLGATVATTTAVGINRVLARAHFPTDVIVGALVGTGIGVLVPHLHRKAPVSVSVMAGPDRAGLVAFGRF